MTITQEFTHSTDLEFAGTLIVDLYALQRNYLALRKIMTAGETGAVVKADAYGLGVGHVAPALYAAGCRHFFVAQLAEAVELREILGPSAAIYILNGLYRGEEPECLRGGLVPVLNTLEQIEDWMALARLHSCRLPALLQVDTGMTRLGLTLAECVRVLSRGEIFQALELLYLVSHLAAADETGNPLNDLQRRRMDTLASRLPGVRISFANSGGLVLGKGYHYQLSRPGIALYCGGLHSGAPEFMRPVVKLNVKVIQIREVGSGTTVGYGGDYVTTSRSRLATIAAGYADGIPRSIHGRGSVFFKGVRLPVRGRVSMDTTIVDVSSLPLASIGAGSEVEVIGENQTLDDFAQTAGTIANEILVRLGRRYKRDYVR